MTEQERLAIVWNQIERLAFKPSSSANKRTWLSMCGRSLHQLWECEPISSNLLLTTCFAIPLLGLQLDYHIESSTKYTLSIKTSEYILWTIHCDPSYEEKPVLSPSESYPNARTNPHLEHDVKKVLEGMIFHPRCHSHLKEIGSWASDFEMNDAPSDPLHEIRISSAEANPFLFMFQLRFQFCILPPNKRDEERNRLLTLFTEAIKTSQNIPPRDLFN